MTTLELSKEDRLKARGLFTVLAKFRELDPEMALNQALTFVWVMLNEGKTQVKMRKDLGMPAASTSRNLAALSKVHRLGKEGLGLIEWHEDPTDRRAKLIYLTTAGRLKAAELLETI